jgi:hypothetical protein
MTYVKVIGTYDDPAAANDARAALIAADLATDGTMWIEPERLSADLHPPHQEVRDRGRVLLIATVRDELAPAARDVMRERSDADVAGYRGEQRACLARDEREVVHSPKGAPRELESD